MTNIIAERPVTASWLEHLGYTLHVRAGTWTAAVRGARRSPEWPLPALESRGRPSSCPQMERYLPNPRRQRSPR